MRVTTGFAIDAPVGDVWDALLDLERVAPCVPGAVIDERVDDSTARGRFRVKLGPVTASYAGTIAIAEADRSSGHVVLHGEARETNASGTATLVIDNRIAAAGQTTTVEMATDLRLTGRAAQFGGRRSMMQSIADRMVADFAAALRDELGAEAHPAEPVAPAPGPVNAAAAPAAAPTPEPLALAAGPLLRGVMLESPWVRSIGGLALAFAAGVAIGRATGSSR